MIIDYRVFGFGLLVPFGAISIMLMRKFFFYRLSVSEAVILIISLIATAFGAALVF